MRGGHFVHVLQTTVLARLVPVKTPGGLGRVGIVHHAVVLAAVQLFRLARVHAVVEIGQDALCVRLNRPVIKYNICIYINEYVYTYIYVCVS